MTIFGMRTKLGGHRRQKFAHRKALFEGYSRPALKKNAMADVIPWRVFFVISKAPFPLWVVTNV